MKKITTFFRQQLRIKRTLAAAFVALFLVSCENDVELNDFYPEIVVEGVIENGENPVVLLSQLLPINMNIDSAKVINTVIRWAKVSVSDGEEEEILVGMRNPNNLLQYEYRALHLRGEVGKTYTLSVEYSGRTLTAVTTIPSPPELKNIEIRPSGLSDTLFSVHALINKPENDEEFYFFRVRKDSIGTVFLPCFLSALDSKYLPEQAIEVYNSLQIDKDFSMYFHTQNSYKLRFCRINKSEYIFWKEYFNQILGTTNPIYPVSSSLSSNIQGGLGIWYGCGVSEYEVKF